MQFIFIASDFCVGGVTSSMRNLCNELIRRGHTVDILNLPDADCLPGGFDDRIRLIPINGLTKFWNLGIHSVFQAKGIRKLAYLMLGVVKKLCNKSNLWNRIVFSNLYLPQKYDVAIGFRQSSVCYWLAARKCNAKVSIGFWHTDSDYENIKALESCLAYPNRIACVSDAITKQMKAKYPQYVYKFGTVYNIFNAGTIQKKGKEFLPYESLDVFKIVTVSRLENTQKRINIIPKICQRLSQKSNKSFHWYIVGDGPDKTEIEKTIRDTGMERYITLTGTQSNPYPYMRCADLFVLCSIWESYGMVITESLISGTPVVAGDYPALHEIITHGKNGIIVRNNPEAIADAIAELLNDANKYRTLKLEAENYRYSSDLAYNQLLNLINIE